MKRTPNMMLALLLALTFLLGWRRPRGRRARRKCRSPRGDT